MYMTFETLKDEQIKALICIFLLLGLTFVCFMYTVEIRSPWFGELSDDRHQWLSGSTLKFSKNWYGEGPLNLGFTMLDEPASIERYLPFYRNSTQWSV